jgi:hypothetical protein
MRMSCTRILALFQKRIEGDDALLRLASLRFREAGLGAEFYAENPAEFNRLMGFRPMPEGTAVVHLSREMNILEESHRNLILDFASAFGSQVSGLVIHDQPEAATQKENYLAALRDIGTRLDKMRNSPLLFVEYAAGLEPGLFVEILQAVRDCERVSGCVDIGHIGLQQVRSAYSQNHPGTDICSLTPEDPRLPLVIEDVLTAVGSALGMVLDVIRTLGRMGKPLHFHFHDGHPLSTGSPFGISDHLSFLGKIPIPFEYRGKYSLDLMFGPSGLAMIVTESLRLLAPEKVSFSLEIHPSKGRLPLGDALPLFDHWVDQTNAERMNYWLSVLVQNLRLLREECHKTLERA